MLLEVIAQGVNTTRYRPATAAERGAARAAVGVPADAFVIAYVGALVPEKDPKLAVEAVARLSDAHLLIAGADGPARAEVEAAAAWLAPRARFLGALEDPGLCYAAADALLLVAEKLRH